MSYVAGHDGRSGPVARAAGNVPTSSSSSGGGGGGEGGSMVEARPGSLAARP